ncbi:hypothetical protein DRQ36_01450 [bacterium]|nr:MAG: hypothetical protein DRQ36_01450 [bacterium]
MVNLHKSIIVDTMLLLSIAVSAIAAATGGTTIEIPARIMAEPDTLPTSWDECLGLTQSLMCSWLIALSMPAAYSDLKIMRGNDGCPFGDAYKRAQILEFNISSIPDSAVISDIALLLDVTDIYTNNSFDPNLGCSDMLANSTRPSDRGIAERPTNLTDALGGNTGDRDYFSNVPVTSTGLITIHLEDYGKEDFTNQLDDDWFAIGLYIDALTGENDTAWVDLSDLRTDHKIKVTYYNPLNITVRNDFDGGEVVIDDTLRVASPYVADWEEDELHYIATDSVQTPGLGVKYLYRYWSDGGARRHQVHISADTLEYRAYFDTLFQIIIESPYGVFTPVDPDSVWIPPGDWVEICISPETVFVGVDSLERHIFQGWQGIGDGSYTGPDSCHWVQMNEPITEYAVWDTAYWLSLDYAGCGGGTPAQFGEGWLNTDDSVYVMTAESLEVGGAWYFFQYWSDGAGHLRDSTAAHTWFVFPDLPRTIIAHYRVDPELAVFPDSLTIVNPGHYVNIPAILDATIPYPTDSFKLTMHFDESKLIFNSLVNSSVIWSELTATPGTNQVTVFGDAPGSTMEIDPDTIFYFRMQATFGASGFDTLTFDDFQYAFADAMTDTGYVQFIPENIDVTVTTDYGGDSVWIDGTPYPAPFSDTWIGAETHNIGADTLNSLGIGEMARFIGWSDFGARFHDINPISDSTFTALFDTLFYLDVVSDFGTPSGSGWFDRGETPGFSVAPETVTVDLTRDIFTGWIGTGTGSYTGTDNPATCTMQSPITETAQWQRQHWLELEFTGAGTATPTLTGEGWQNESTWVAIEADSFVDEARARYYFAWWSGGTVGDRFRHSTNAFIGGPDTIIAVYADVPFSFAMDIPETTIAPPGDYFELPVMLNIPTSTELGEISFHARFDGNRIGYSGIADGSLIWDYLTGTDLSSGSDGHIYVDASVAGTIPVEPQDTLCVLTFLVESGTSGIDTMIVCDPGSDLLGADPDSGLIIMPGQIEVTLTTAPLLGEVTIDGSPHSAPFTAFWDAYDGHIITVDSVQYPETGTQILYTGWSDTGAREHTVSPVCDTTFTANFDIRYRLDVFSDWGTTGGSGWFVPTTEVPFNVTPDSVHDGDSYYLFQSWTGIGDGSYTGTANPSLATVNEPLTETANWEAHHYVTLNYTGTPAVPTLEGEGWYIEGDTAGIEAPDSVADGPTWYYFLYWDGAGDLLDTYSDSTGAIITEPLYLTAVYGDNPADFLFGPPLQTFSEGDAFCAVPVIFSGDPIDADTVGFTVGFDSALATLDNLLPGSLPLDYYDLTGPADLREITVRSDTVLHIFDGDTLLTMLFYVSATSGTVPLVAET